MLAHQFAEALVLAVGSVFQGVGPFLARVVSRRNGIVGKFWFWVDKYMNPNVCIRGNPHQALVASYIVIYFAGLSVVPSSLPDLALFLR